MRQRSILKLNLSSILCIAGADLGGRVQGVRTPPWDYLQFSNTTGILQKKKKNWFIGVEVKSKRRVHPLLKEILDPPLHCVLLVVTIDFKHADIKL